MTPDAFALCGQEGQPQAWEVGRRVTRGKHKGELVKTGRPTCNRARGHDGPHRTYDATSFALLAEWPALRSTLPRA